MAYLHQVVIDYVCEIVCREAVRLDKYLVVHLGVVDRNLSVVGIGKCSGTLSRYVLSDNEGISGCKFCLNLLFGEG